MDELFQIYDSILLLHSNIKKNRNITKSTKKKKKLLVLKNKFKSILIESKYNYTASDLNALVDRYKKLKVIANEAIKLLNGTEESDSTGSEDKYEMAEENKLDITLAIKLVDRFDGDTTKLLNFIENVNLLKDYSTDVPDNDIISFIKTRLIGSAHKAIEGVTILNEVFDTLKLKFGIEITPKAIEKEMFALKQGKKTISEFGNEMNALAAKLAAAHVSQGTFNNESSAAPIVQPIAVNAFSAGLRDAQTSFFIKARNPTNLTKAISDALEVAPIPAASTENALSINSNNRLLNSTSSYHKTKYSGFNRQRKFYSDNFIRPTFNYNRRYNFNRTYNSNYSNFPPNRTYNSNTSNSPSSAARNNNRNDYQQINRRNQINFAYSDQHIDRQNSNRQNLNPKKLFLNQIPWTYFVLSMNNAIRATFILYNKHIDFIIDSGASCCIIDYTCIPKWVPIDDKTIINIRGVNGVTSSVGSVYTFLQYGKYSLPVTFLTITRVCLELIS